MAGSNYIRKAAKAVIAECDAIYTDDDGPLSLAHPLRRSEIDARERLRYSAEFAAKTCRKAIDAMLEHEVPYCRAKRLYFMDAAYWLYLLRRSAEAGAILDRFHEFEGKHRADEHLLDDLKQLRQFVADDAERLIVGLGTCELCGTEGVRVERIDSGEPACSSCVEDFDPDLFVEPALDPTYGHARVLSRRAIAEERTRARQYEEAAEIASFGVVMPKEGFRSKLGLRQDATNAEVVAAALKAGCLPVYDVDFITVIDRQQGVPWAGLRDSLAIGTPLRLVPTPDDGTAPNGVSVRLQSGGQLGRLREHVAMDISYIAEKLTTGFGFTATVVGFTGDRRVEGVKIRVRSVRAASDYESHAAEIGDAHLAVVQPPPLPVSIPRMTRPIDFERIVVFDVETWKILPEEANPRDHLPLGMTVAAIGECNLLRGPKIALGIDFRFAMTEEHEFVTRMGQYVASHIVDELLQWVDRGYTPVTWNGAGFDFRVLATESGRHDDCAFLAANHVDLMFQFLCCRGFPISLDAAAEGSLGQNKADHLPSHEVPAAWRSGRHDDVLEYLKQDIVLTACMAEFALRNEAIRWIAKSGMPMVGEIGPIRRIRDCLDTPRPDTSWMTEPIGRGEFCSWLGDPDPIDPTASED